MKIKHKNSQEETTEFPSYQKIDGRYGYLSLTFDNKVLFFCIDHNCFPELFCEDVTENYDIIL